VKGQRMHVRREMKENEENRGFNAKKSSKDKFVTFFMFRFGALSLFYLTYTLGQFLEHS